AGHRQGHRDPELDRATAAGALVDRGVRSLPAAAPGIRRPLAGDEGDGPSLRRPAAGTACRTRPRRPRVRLRGPRRRPRRDEGRLAAKEPTLITRLSASSGPQEIRTAGDTAA